MNRLTKLLLTSLAVLVLSACGGGSSSSTPPLITFNLTILVDGAGVGTVTSSPAGIDCGIECSESYTENTVVTLTALPATSSVFSGWSGACTGIGSCLVIVDAAKSVTATFTADIQSSDVIYTNVSILSANVNDAAAADIAPEISSNGLELYFHSDRDGGLGVSDLWVSTRNAAIDNWGVATNLGATVNSVSQDHAATISNDGLTLIFASDRIGGFGDLDLYMITRPTLSGAWSAPVNLGGVINTQFIERSPEISTDGLSLYFHSDVPGGFGVTDLYVSTRASILDPWEPSINLGGVVNSPESDGAPEIASDGLSLYFHSTRTGGPGLLNIWRTTRASVNDAWAAPEVLPMPINSTSTELAPSLSDDWQTLYFTSDVGGNRDIWQAVP